MTVDERNQRELSHDAHFSRELDLAQPRADRHRPEDQVSHPSLTWRCAMSSRPAETAPMPEISRMLDTRRSGMGVSFQLSESLWDSVFAYALDWLTCGVIIIDEDVQPLFANRAATQLIDSGRLPLAHQPTLYCFDAIADLRRAAASLDLASDAASCRIGQPPLMCRIVSLAGHAAKTRAHAIVFVTDTAETRKIQIGDVAGLGLTRAEGAVAVEFANGHSLKACAKRLEISLTTAKTHLQRIFQKTGVCRQAELMRLILTSRTPFNLMRKG